MKSEKKNEKKNGKIFGKLAVLIRKRWLLLIFSILLAAISVILQLYVPILFGDAIDQVVAAGKVDFSKMWFYLRWILILASTA